MGGAQVLRESLLNSDTSVSNCKYSVPVAPFSPIPVETQLQYLNFGDGVGTRSALALALNLTPVLYSTEFGARSTEMNIGTCQLL